jgi:2-dehydropantoate 2-reductase
MRICIYGAGAIGGYMGVLLSRAGADVSFVARGAHLAAMQRNGAKLLIGDNEYVAHPRCTDDPAELGHQDLIVIALKAHSVSGVVPAMLPLIGSDTALLTAVNGIPFWYFYGHGGKWQDSVVESVDPDGVQWRMLRPDRAIGCVVYPATEVIAPGVIQHVYGNKLPIGEPDGTVSGRVQSIADVMTAAGFDAPIRDRIRDEIWLKLWGNLAFNPISALTCATLDVICADAGTRDVARAMMLEAKAVGERLGVHFRVDVERRIDGAARVGAHKTSMLQDLERRRAMEIDALVASVQELGRRVGVPTPTIDTVLALVRQRAKLANLH